MNWMQHGDKYNERRRNSRAQGQRVEDDDAPVIDYTKGGTKPPSFSGITQAPKQQPEPVVDYMKGDPAPGGRRLQLDYSGVPNWIRRDRVRADRMAQEAAAEDEPSEMSSWDALQARGQRQANTVSFGRSAVDMSGLRGGRPSYPITNAAAAGTLYGPSPVYGEAAAGRSVRPVQPPRQNPGPQRLPHIVN